MRYIRASRSVCIGVMAGLISGCAIPPAAQYSQSSPAPTLSEPIEAVNFKVSCSTQLTPEHGVEMDAIDSMMASGDNYAALARLEALSFQTQYHWLRWARLLAKVEQLEYSEKVYQQVASLCGTAGAYHGLGVVFAKQGKVEQAAKALARAKALEPASADLRNDYGVVLMQSGKYGMAAFELRTAYELSGRNPGMGRSMVAAYYLNGGLAAVKGIQQPLELSDALVEQGIAFAGRF